jgi:hypothetical protein
MKLVIRPYQKLTFRTRKTIHLNSPTNLHGVNLNTVAVLDDVYRHCRFSDVISEAS